MLRDHEDRAQGEQLLLEGLSPSEPAARTPAPQERSPEGPIGESYVADFPKRRESGDTTGERRESSDKVGKRRSRRPIAIALGLLLTAPAAAAGYLYWDYTGHFESTDDAFLAARQFTVAPEVSGYVTGVPVTDNQHVAAGTVIARLDTRDYRVALDQAKAQLAHDQVVLAQAQTNLGRYQYLVQHDAIATQQRDDQNYLVEEDKATVALDQAKVDAAQLNLSYTTVTAAQSGRVVNLGAAVGQYVPAGTTLTNFVPDEIWITANFKETQLAAMRPGQPVTVTIDAYPNRIIRGHVASVQPGSGTAFSLLPPENATGNWVKVVQRVPVKIIMDNPPTDITFGPGMSVEASVRVNPNPSLYEQLRAWL